MPPLLRSFVFVLFLAVPAIIRAETSRDAALESWRANRFGLFIHWGPVSVQGTEIGWSRNGERRGYQQQYWKSVPVEVYDNLYKQFNPVAFDARQWVAIARAAGMKYIVFTTRHHDGFSMFDTKVSDYKITSPLSPFRRDVVKELAEATHAAGLKFGVYYSQPDWHHPDAFVPERHARYLAYLKAQLRELLTNYGKVDILWFDGLRKSSADYDSAELNRMARELQLDILINNRNGDLPEDFDTPEQRVGSYKDDRPWESCITVCRQWSWKPGDDMKSLKDIVQSLVLSAGGDGNLLLNVGPMPDGRIEPRQVDRLKEVGAWLARNGQSIYETRGGPWKPTKGIASTRKGNTIYVHILREVAGPVHLPALPHRVRSASLLDGGQPVQFTQEEGKITLTLPSSGLDAVDPVVRLELDGSAMEISPISLPAEVKASSSNPTGRPDSRNDPAFAFDLDSNTHWSPETPLGAWVAADFGQARTINRIRIDEPNEGVIKRFDVQYRVDGEWKTIFSGTTIGRYFQRSFPPVKAQEFRMNILEASGVPVIADIEFFEK
jgi:alpha-L-fucosidase